MGAGSTFAFLPWPKSPGKSSLEYSATTEHCRMPIGSNSEFELGELQGQDRPRSGTTVLGASSNLDIVFLDLQIVTAGNPKFRIKIKGGGPGQGAYGY